MSDRDQKAVFISLKTIVTFVPRRCVVFKIILFNIWCWQKYSAK